MATVAKPPLIQSSKARPSAPVSASSEAVGATRQAVRQLLQRSEAFNALDEDKRRKLANDLVQIGSYLAEPDGVRLKASQQKPASALVGGNRCFPTGHRRQQY